MNVLILLLFALEQSSGAQPLPAAPPVAHQSSGLSIAGIRFEPADIASAAQSFDTYDATPNVVITFTETGRAKFQRLQQGQVGQQLAISVDGEVISSPVLRELITGNRVTISGGAFTAEQAQALVRRIAPPR